MKTLYLSSIIFYFLVSTANAATSYDGFRWFQVEVSIFTNEFAEDRNSEFSSPERLQLAYPDNIREFSELSDFFQIGDLTSEMLSGPNSREPSTAALTEIAASDDTEIQLAASKVGPFPALPLGNLRLPDFARDAYLFLPDSQSDFQTTNSRLDQSPDNRLLFHGVWRQPVVGTRRAESLVIKGGTQYGQHHELEGSITIRFNENEDRVVIDTDLWLSDFTRSAVEQNWKLPLVGETGVQRSNTRPGSGYNISRIVQMQQSRDMRSTEFHYLDHPSLGVVISLFPYDLPSAAPTFSFELQEPLNELPVTSPDN